jgi:hypothetical protein
LLEVKTLKMTFIFLPKQHPQTLASLPDGKFYTKDWLRSFIVQVPNGCVPVWCEYTGNWIDHSWKNPISGHVYEKHPLGLPESDGFYEISEIEGLTFGEGEAWCPDTNTKIHIEKTDPMSIWNPFFQQYDPRCNKHFSCKGVQKEMESSSGRGSYLYLDIFTNCRHLFLDVYCGCGLKDGYEHHTDSDSD